MSVNIKERCRQWLFLSNGSRSVGLFTTVPVALGELDHVPEVAFYMVGNIDDVLAAADKLAQ